MKENEQIRNMVKAGLTGKCRDLLESKHWLNVCDLLRSMEKQLDTYAEYYPSVSCLKERLEETEKYFDTCIPAIWLRKSMKNVIKTFCAEVEAFTESL